jgi:hypothetical protein
MSSARTAALTLARNAFPARAQLNLDPSFFLNLVTPALLLALMKLWTLGSSHKYGIYFTAEAATFLYSYFALSRAIYLHHNGRDHQGRHDPARARKAKQDFHRQVKPLLGQLAPYAVPLLMIAATLDLLSMSSPKVQRDGAQKLILMAEILVWLRLAPVLILATARWSSLKPFDWTAARQLIAANLAFVIPSFLLAALVILFAWILASMTLTAVMTLSPNFMLLVFGAGAVAFALWIQCLWSDFALAELCKPPARPARTYSPDLAHIEQPTRLGRFLMSGYDVIEGRRKIVITAGGLHRLVMSGGLFIAPILCGIAIAKNQAHLVPHLLAILAAVCLSLLILTGLRSPPERIEIDRNAGTIVTVRTYFWLITRSLQLDAAEIKSAIVDEKKVWERDGRALVAYTPMLLLQSGERKHLAKSRTFTEKQACRIVEAINAFSVRNTA